MSDQQYPYNQPPQQPYGQQPYGSQQPYGGQQPYGQQPGMYGPSAPERRSSMLGLIGLGLVLVCAIALIASAAVLGSAFGDLMVSLGIDAQNIDEQTLANDPRFDAFVDETAMLWLLAQGAAFLGFVGWIISIVATATKRGRVPGIWGIILGVLAPIIAMIIGIATMWPAIEAMVS